MTTLHTAHLLWDDEMQGGGMGRSTATRDWTAMVGWVYDDLCCDDPYQPDYEPLAKALTVSLRSTAEVLRK